MSITTYDRCYSELIKLKTFEERFEYLKLDGQVADFTFNGRRQLNQLLYHSPEWRSFRREIAIRDDGCDLAHPDHKIFGKTLLIVHHINPIRVEDIINRSPKIFDKENVVLTIDITHKAIHYGTSDLLYKDPIERKENDTCLWR